jgi:hypothetical protein
VRGPGGLLTQQLSSDNEASHQDVGSGGLVDFSLAAFFSTPARESTAEPSKAHSDTPAARTQFSLAAHVRKAAALFQASVSLVHAPENLPSPLPPFTAHRALISEGGY